MSNNLQAMRRAVGRLDTPTIKSGQIASPEWVRDTLAENRRIADLLAGEDPTWTEEDNGIMQRIAHRLALCNTRQFVGLVGKPGQWRVVVQDTYRCMHRWCKTCGWSRSRKWRQKIAGWIDGETGASWVDGNGKLAGDRDVPEVMADVSNRLSHIAVMQGGVPGHSATPEGVARLARALEKAERQAEGEIQRHRETWYYHLVTLTVPNIPHVWTYDHKGRGYSPVDQVLLLPFRKMMQAAKKAAQRRKDDLLPVSSKGRKAVPGLRMMSRWKGYIAALEITWNARTKTFHPHLHVLVMTTQRWVSEKLLLAVWRRYAGDAVTQVDARRADPSTVGQELIKYLTKTKSIKSRKAAREMARALYRRRAIWTGGAAYGVKYSRWKQIAEQEKRIASPASDAGWHVVRRWNVQKSQWEYRIVGRASEDAPIRTQEDRMINRKQGWDGELLPEHLLQHEVDRRYTRQRQTRLPSDNEQQAWYRKEEAAQRRMMFDLYRKNEPTFVIYEWILLLIQVKFAELLPVVGGQPWRWDESGNGWVEVHYGEGARV